MTDLQVNPNHLRFIVYVDPICCWSWGILSKINHLKTNVGVPLDFEIRVGGLIGEESTFFDSEMNIKSISHWTPLWMANSTRLTDLLEVDIREKNITKSSRTACIAIAALRLQSREAAYELLWKLSSLVMVDGKDILSWDFLLDEVKELAMTSPGLFDYGKFEEDFFGPSAREEFRKDLELASIHQINRFPTLLIMNSESKKTNRVVGFRSYEELCMEINSTADLELD